MHVRFALYRVVWQSQALFDGEGTTTNDKINDNLFFSCCCGQGGSYLWRQVCDCQTTLYNANLTCIVEALSFVVVPSPSNKAGEVPLREMTTVLFVLSAYT
jgi:hypothetical protein